MSFNQGIPGPATLINSSSTLLYGNAASANALSVQQLGTGNVATFRTTTGATALFVSSAGNVGVGTTSPATALDVFTGTMNAATVVATTHYGAIAGSNTVSASTVTGGTSVSAPTVVGSTALYGVLAGSNTVSGTTMTAIATPAAAANVLTVVGSSTTGNVVQFSNSAGGTFVMTNAGRVGLGVVNPGYILEVSSSTASTSTSFLGLTNPYVFGFNTGLNIGSSIVYSSRWQGDGVSGVVEMCKIDGRKEQNANFGDSYLAFQTRYVTDRGNGGAGTLTEKMRISGNGNVGIGTTTIGGGVGKLWSANDVTLVAGNYAGDVAAQIMAVGTTNPLKRLALMYDTTNNIGLVQAMIAGTGTSPLCLNAAGGNVGIGTTSPGSALHTVINSASATTIATFENLNTTTTTAKSFKLQFYGNGAGGQKDVGAITIVPTDGNFGYNDMAFSIRGPFGASSAEAVAEVMRFSRSGTTPCVGIGTTSPSGKLTVATSGGGTSGGGGWDANWSVVHGTTVGAAGGGVGIAYNDGNYGVLSCVSPTVGWRTMLYSAWRHDFYLSGTFALAMYNIMTGGATTISVDASGGLQRGAVSDQRLKSNILTMTEFGLKTITDLRPVTYEATPESLKRIGAGVHIGLVAQEVQTIFPYAVSADQDEQKTLTIDYIKLVPVMINAIKELSTENTQLKTQLTTMDARLAALEAKLNSQ